MKKGFTLIELVVILALFALVLSVSMSFLIGSKRNFERSQDASEIHYQVRRASEYIRDEVRNATSIEIVEIPSSPDSAYDYLYVMNNQLVHVVSSTGTVKTSKVLVENTMMFTLSQDTNGNCILSYTVEGSIEGVTGIRNYDVSTSIHLNNIFEILGNKGTVYSSTNQCIKYTKP